MKDKDYATALTTVSIAILLIALFPFVVLWTINTLWCVDRPYDLTHWLAAFLFCVIFCGRKSK